MFKIKLHFFILLLVLAGLTVFFKTAVAEEFYCGSSNAKWNRDYSVWPTIGKYDLQQFPVLSGFICVPGTRGNSNSKTSAVIRACEKNGSGNANCEVGACDKICDGQENGVLCCKKNEICARISDCVGIGGVCCDDSSGRCDDKVNRKFLKQRSLNCSTGTVTNNGDTWQIIRFRCGGYNPSTCWRKIIKPGKKPPEEKKPPDEIIPGLEETPRDPKKTPNISVSDCCRQIVPPLDDPYTNDYTLNDVVQTAVNVYECILCIVGALILMALVAGAIILMISGGNDKRVAMGKQIITGAVIGGVIVFFSFLIVNFVVKAVGARFIDEGKVQVNPQGYLPPSDSLDKTS